jgi:benzylsuccinate CoA-transferase BbsE subunit
MVNYVIYGGKAGAEANIRLVKWLDEEGFATDYLKQIDFENWDVTNITSEEWEKVEGPFGKFLMSHTKTELFLGGMKRLLPICPVSSPSEVVNFFQLSAREFWTEVEHPELGVKIKYPGFCTRLSETPCRVTRRAPLIGEHNLKIYGEELGLTLNEMISLKQADII